MARAFAAALERLRAWFGCRKSARSATRRTRRRSSKVSFRDASMRLRGCCTTAGCTSWRSSTNPIRSTGRFFEETIYVTPSSAPDAVQDDIVRTVTRAAAAIGLHHGPIHAECRVNDQGGLCSKWPRARLAASARAHFASRAPGLGTRESGFQSKSRNPSPVGRTTSPPTRSAKIRRRIGARRSPPAS